MTDLEPWLAACEHALAEAELQLERLTGLPPDLAPELTAVRLMIAALRLEVEQLHGGPIPATARKTSPKWIDRTGWRPPWPSEPGLPPRDRR